MGSREQVEQAVGGRHRMLRSKAPVSIHGKEKNRVKVVFFFNIAKH